MAAAEPEVVLQVGHGMGFQEVSINGDGSRILTKSSDNRALLWDVNTGRQLRSFAPSGTDLEAVFLSADGTKVLAGTKANNAILWDATTGKEIRVFEGHKKGLTAVAMTPDCKYVVTASWDETVGLWDAVTARRIHTFKGHRSPQRVAISDDGDTVVSQDLYETFIWSGTTGKMQRKLIDEKDGASFWGLAVNGDASRIATRTLNQLVIWSGATCKKLHVWSGGDNLPLSGALSSDGKRGVVASSGDDAFLLDVETGKKLFSFPHKSRERGPAAISADGKRVVTLHRMAAQVWDASSGKPIAQLNCRTRVMTSVSISSDGTHLAASSLWGWVSTWDLMKGVPLASTLRKKGFMSVALNATGERAITWSQGNVVSVWDVKKAATLREFTPLPNDTQLDWLLAIAADGKTVVKGPKPFLQVFEVDSDRTVFGMRGDDLQLGAFAVSSDAKVLAIATRKGLITLLRTSDGTSIKTIEGEELIGLALNGDGSRLAVLLESDKVMIWDVSRGAVRQTIPRDKASFVALSSDGRFAALSDQHRVAVLDLASSKKLYELSRQRFWSNVLFTPDSKHLVRIDSEAAISFVRTTTGKETCRLLSLDEGAEWLVVTPDGRYDGSKGALNAVALRKPGSLEFLPGEEVIKRFSPGLFREVMSKSQ
jgi:WD40 repeat protein